MRDFDPIWLDDHLDYLIVPNDNALAPGAPLLTGSDVLQVLTAYLREQQGFVASSRDIGRHLQSKIVNGRDALSQLKQRHAGLRAFVDTFPDTFEIEHEPPNGATTSQEDPDGPFTFYVRMLSPEDGDDFSNDEILMDAKIGRREEMEEAARQSDASTRASSGRSSAAAGAVAGAIARAASAATADEGGVADAHGAAAEGEGGASAQAAGFAGAERLEHLTVPELRGELRVRGLPTLGRKAELLARLRGADSRGSGAGGGGGAAGVSGGTTPHAVRDGGAGSGGGGYRDRESGSGTGVAYVNGLAQPSKATWSRNADQRGGSSSYGGRDAYGGGAYGRGSSGQSSGQSNGQDAYTNGGGGGHGQDAADGSDETLQSSVVEYLEASGGVASSRNVGRHLAAAGLLNHLKREHAGLFHFLQKHESAFRVVLPSEPGALEYEVRLRRGTSDALMEEVEEAPM